MSETLYEKYEPTPDEIKEFRTHHRLTREELGALVYTTPRAVQAWEVGTRRMGAAIWELLLWKVDGIPIERAEFHNPHQLYMFEEEQEAQDNVGSQED